MDRAAILWILLVIVGLLIGLVILVTALGVARHLRRPRPPTSRMRRRASRDPDDEDADPSGGWRRNQDADDDQSA